MMLTLCATLVLLCAVAASLDAGTPLGAAGQCLLGCLACHAVSLHLSASRGLPYPPEIVL